VGVTLASLLFVLLMALVLGAGPRPPAPMGTPSPSRLNCFTCISASPPSALMWGDERLESLGQLGVEGGDVRRSESPSCCCLAISQPACPRVSYQHEDLYV